MRNRIIALLISFILVLQLVTVVSAETSVGDSSDELSVKVLNGLGIMGVDEHTGDFWDNTPVERREMAQILCALFRLVPECDSTALFTDVAEKDRPYVETAVRNGYMSGYGNGLFGPKDYMTVNQAVKIIVSALGAASIAEYEGGFPDGYISIARRLKLLKNGINPTDAQARRIDVANLIYNALNTEMVEPSVIRTDEIIFSTIKGETMLTEKLNIYRFEGVVEKNELTSLDSASGVSEGMVTVDGETYEDPDNLLNGLLGSRVIIFVEKPKSGEIGKIVYGYEDSKNKTVTIAKDDLVDISGFTVNYIKDNKKAKLEMSSLIYVIYNGKYVEYEQEKFNIENGYIRFVDNDRNGDFDVALINDYKSLVANSVSQDGNIIQFKYGEASINLEDMLYNVYLDGQPAKPTDIGSGDVLLVAMSENTVDKKYVKIDIVTERVIGNIEKIVKKDGYDYISVGGAEYRIGDYCKSLVAKEYIGELTPEYSGQFFTDGNGTIVYYKINNSSVKAGYIIKAAFIDDVFSSKLTYVIYTEEGKIETYSTDDTIKVNDVKTVLSDIDKSGTLYKDLVKSQLIEYTLKDGVITSINIASEGYNIEEFSQDFTGSILCTSKSILGYKYLVSATTKVFYIPNPPKAHEDYDDIIVNPTYYNMYTGTYFNGDSNYTLTLYDINPDSEVKYAVIKKNPVDADMWHWDKLLAVTSVSEAMDANENLTKAVTGYNEAGNEVTFTAANNTVMIDSLYKREPMPGDVVQYRTDSKGMLSEVQIQHRVDEPDYYLPAYIERVLVNRNAFKCYGEVAAKSSTGIKLCCKAVTGEVSPNEVDMLVTGGGAAVYGYDSARKRIFKLDFADIVPGDKVFVCLTTSNNARMIVVYR